VEAAAFVEEAAAGGAAVGGEVGVDAQLGPADSAEDGLLAAAVAGPLACGVVRGFLVAEVARVVAAAAEELDGDDVDGRAVVDAPGLVVDRGTEDGRGRVGHGGIVARGDSSILGSTSSDANLQWNSALCVGTSNSRIVLDLMRSLKVDGITEIVFNKRSDLIVKKVEPK